MEDQMRTYDILVEWNNGKVLEVPAVNVVKNQTAIKKKEGPANEVDHQEKEETEIEIGIGIEVNDDVIGTETETEIAVMTVTEIAEKRGRIEIVKIAIKIAKIVPTETVVRIALKEIVDVMTIVSKDRVMRTVWRDWKKVKNLMILRKPGNHVSPGNPVKNPALESLESEKKERIVVARIANAKIEETARIEEIVTIRVTGSDGNVDVVIVIAIVIVAVAVIGIVIVNAVVIEIGGIEIVMTGRGMVKGIEIANGDEIVMKENCLMMITMA